MQEVQAPIPDGFVGNYRVTFEHNAKVDGVKKRLCFVKEAKVITV